MVTVITAAFNRRPLDIFPFRVVGNFFQGGLQGLSDFRGRMTAPSNQVEPGPATKRRAINHPGQPIPQEAGQQVFNRVQSSRRNRIFIWLNQA